MMEDDVFTLSTIRGEVLTFQPMGGQGGVPTFQLTGGGGTYLPTNGREVPTPLARKRLP